MAQTTLTLKVPADKQGDVFSQFEAAGFERREVPHAFWQMRDPGAVVTFYKSGKVVLQGSAVEPWADAITEKTGATVAKKKSSKSGKKSAPPQDPNAPPFAYALDLLPDPKPSAWIGIDETGKGDFFGPLVVCAARVHIDELPLLAELGVQDSKRMKDKAILKLAGQLKSVVPHRKLILRPAKYNELYAKIGNLNKLLAWGHATAAENLLEDGVEAELILSDQFAKGDIVKRRLKERGSKLRFDQRTKGESDPAVACASILARAEFVYLMRDLEREFGVTLPKGAGAPVLREGRKIVAERGREILRDVAKLHFKTAKQLG